MLIVLGDRSLLDDIYHRSREWSSPGPPPLFLLNDTHQRSKNAKKGYFWEYFECP